MDLYPAPDPGLSSVTFRSSDLLLITFEGTFASFFKDKKVSKKSQNRRSKSFSPIFAWWWKDSYI
jgi:hypothetical protein